MQITTIIQKFRIAMNIQNFNNKMYIIQVIKLAIILHFVNSIIIDF